MYGKFAALSRGTWRTGPCYDGIWKNLSR